jgi:hypothetical protein
MSIQIEKMLNKDRRFIDHAKDPEKFFRQNVACTIVDRKKNTYLVCEDYCLITFKYGMAYEIDYREMSSEKFRVRDISIRNLTKDWMVDIGAIDQLYDKHRVDKIFL